MRPVTAAIVVLFMIIANASKAEAGSGVYINDVELEQPQVEQLAQAYATPVQPGKYWYDRMTGAWGLACGPGLALGLPNLELGGELKADASCGNTGVFVNGRELHQVDLLALQSLAGRIAPGRYWMDAELNAGIEGGPALVNYRLLAAHKNVGGASAGGGDHFWSSKWGAGNSSADGSYGYVSVPGHGPVGYGY